MNRLRSLLQAFESMSPAAQEIFLDFGKTLASKRSDSAPIRSGRVLPFPRRVNAPRQSVDQVVEDAPRISIRKSVDGQ